MQDFYKHYEEDSTTETYLSSSISTTRIFTTILTACNVLILNGNVIMLIIFLFSGLQLLLLPVFIPLINHDTLLGYLINLGLQMSMGFIGFFTFTSYDTSIILYGHHGSLMTRIFEVKLKNLEEHFESEHFYEKFVEVVQLYGEYKSYMKEFENLVKLPFFTAIFVNFVGMTLCILVAINESVTHGVAGSIGLNIGFLLPLITMSMISHQVKIFL